MRPFKGLLIGLAYATALWAVLFVSLWLFLSSEKGAVPMAGYEQPPLGASGPKGATGTSVQ